VLQELEAKKTAHIRAVKALLDDPSVRSLIKSGRSISDDERVALLLKALNDGHLTLTELLGLWTGTKLKRSGKPMQLDAEYLQATRGLLASHIEDATLTAIRRVMLAGKLTTSLVLVPELPDWNQPGEMRYRTLGSTPDAGFDYAEWLLLTKYSDRLCRCQLDTCGRFFLAVTLPEGRTPKKYCSSEHREQKLKGEGAERVAASRAGIPVSQWRKLKSKEKGK
jgi:hypothetical protein